MATCNTVSAGLAGWRWSSHRPWRLRAPPAPRRGHPTTASRATFAEEDAQLNARYQALLAKTRPAAWRAWLEAQRAWIRFRDLECESQVAASGPINIHNELVHDCLDSVTYERRAELERQLQCPGVEGIICDAPR